MSLTPGTRLGAYEVLALVGSGGMGEVYRARDTRLDRTVAIKILRGTHADLQARFAREAKAIAALAHPHICTLFDIGHWQGTDYLVMEYLEGETLSNRLERGALPLDQALTTAIEIGDALDRAHRAGMVHRDLKPSNVMLTKAGAKLLDFGLATFHAAPQIIVHTVDTATMVQPLPGAGVGLTGTVPYMAPEQLEGREADARSDLFAFGALLYEMVTGRRAFVGESQASVIAAILEHEPPPISTWQPLAPPALARIAKKCLAKDPEDRWQTARDLVDQLRWIAEDRTSNVPVAPLRRQRNWKTIGALALVSVVVVGASAAIVSRLSSVGAARSGGAAVRFEIAPPVGTAFGISSASPGLAINAETTSFQLSPDGSRLAFVATDPSGRTGIWLRMMTALAARLIPGTEDARSLFWSPDGRSIAFSANGKLKRLDLAGGPAVPLCDVTEGPGVNGTWGNGAILFTQGGRIYRVPTAGGGSTAEVQPNASNGEISVGWPWFLPDGRRFFYLLRLPNREGRLMLADPGKPTVTVLSALSNAQWVDPDYLVFSRDETLLGQRIDLVNDRVVGEPFAIADSVQHLRGASRAAFSVSRAGALAYQAHSDKAELVWFDRSGRELGSMGPQGDYLTMRISPKGRRAFAARGDPQTGRMVLRVLDFERPDAETRLTSEPRSEMGGVWMPDETGAFFSAETAGGSLQIFYKDLGTGVEKQVRLPAKGLAGAEDVSPDGRQLAFFQRTDDGGQDLWTMPVDASRPPSLLGAKVGVGAHFSPDGRFVAFVSRESGRAEVYVAPSSPSGQRTRVSTQGGDMPRWSAGGHELIYRSEGHIVSVPVRAGASAAIEVGLPVTLFAITGKWPWRDFDIAPDGRFLAIVPRLMANEQSLTVVLNWTADVAR